MITSTARARRRRTRSEPDHAGPHTSTGTRRAPGGRHRPRTSDDAGSLVFGARTRWIGSGAAVAVGIAVVLASAFVPAGPDWYLATLVLAAAPFATPGLLLVRRVIHDGPRGYQPFWRWWFAAAATAYAAGTVALVGVVTHTSAPLALAAVLLVAAVPLWCSASVRMLRAQAGRRAVAVDLLGALTALVVFGAPAVLSVAEPLTRADHPWFVAPFVASIVFVPAGLYLSLHSLTLVPRGERATQGIAMALGAAFALNASAQIAQILSDFTLALPVLILFQVLNMGLLMAVPLWAHRRPVSVLHDLLPEQQVRSTDPLAVAGAVIVPALAWFAWTTRAEDPWRLAVVLVALAAVVVLGAARHAVLTAETRRLHAEVERVAEERRALLASMVRALEDDRHRVAAELHVQAVESFVAMSALVQSAYITLPPDTALAVKESIAHLQDDLGGRADALRRLTAAVRPPAFASDAEEVPGHVLAGAPEARARRDTALGAALRGAAGQLVDQRSDTVVVIDVDPQLELDWSTTTIVYRIAQEAIANAAEHARATTITVTIGAQGDAIDIRIVDDGVGFDPAATTEGSGSARMRLFAELGNGLVRVDATPGVGTVVHAVLGRGTAATGAGPVSPAVPAPRRGSGRARHLLLVATEPTAEPADEPADEPAGDPTG